ncbi:MAG: hypothetical protein IJ184_03805 [Alphaproteobacteria bacterium]|nr:hypothetical protein [Alphaproteobacteria bacterium]
MKKICVLVLMSLMLASPAYARGGHGGAHHYHHHFHYRPMRYAGDVAVGVLGAAAGFALADAIVSANRPRTTVVESAPKVYIAEPENKCYTVVSRKKGTVTRKCVSDTGDDIIYVD